MCHVKTEFGVIQKVLSVVDKRREELGARVAGRDIENGLEDVVSVFEAVLKIITIKHLANNGMSHDEISKRLEKSGILIRILTRPGKRSTHRLDWICFIIPHKTKLKH